MGYSRLYASFSRALAGVLNHTSEKDHLISITYFLFKIKLDLSSSSTLRIQSCIHFHISCQFVMSGSCGFTGPFFHYWTHHIPNKVMVRLTHALAMCGHVLTE